MAFGIKVGIKGLNDGREGGGRQRVIGLPCGWHACRAVRASSVERLLLCCEADDSMPLNIYGAAAAAWRQWKGDVIVSALCLSRRIMLL